jgi:hypothetical protein
MDVNKDVAQLFLLAISMGTFLFTIITPSILTGAGLIKLVSSISLGSLIISELIFATQAKLHSVPLVACYVITTIFLISFRKLHKDERTTVMNFIYAVLIISYTCIFYFYAQGVIPTFFYMLLTALFLGITNYAMTLGHYYLVVPKLSEWPLLKSLKIFWILIAVKIGISTWGYIEGGEFFDSGTRLGSGYMFNWIMLTMRVLWGYVALGVLSIFAYKLCKMRSIQSATGIFYVMVFFVFIGELISGYLFYNYGLYL